jgi:hypothetical protein
MHALVRRLRAVKLNDSEITQLFRRVASADDGDVFFRNLGAIADGLKAARAPRETAALFGALAGMQRPLDQLVGDLAASVVHVTASKSSAAEARQVAALVAIFARTPDAAGRRSVAQTLRRLVTTDAPAWVLQALATRSANTDPKAIGELFGSVRSFFDRMDQSGQALGSHLQALELAHAVIARASELRETAYVLELSEPLLRAALADASANSGSDLLARLLAHVRADDFPGELQLAASRFAANNLSLAEIAANLHKDPPRLVDVRRTWEQRVQEAASLINGVTGPDAKLVKLMRQLAPSLGDGEIGLLFRHAGWIRALAPASPAQSRLLKRLLAGRTLKNEGDYEVFRHALRDELLKSIFAAPDGPRRVQRLSDLMAADVLPEPAAKGHLFADYMRMRLGLERVNGDWRSSTAGSSVGELEPVLRPVSLEAGGDVDAWVKVVESVPDGPALGVHGVEYKAGEDAFKLEQAVRYAIAMRDGTLAEAGTDPARARGRGMIYVCDGPGNAQETASALADARTRALEGLTEPQLSAAAKAIRFYVAFPNHRGEIEWLSVPP